MAIVPVGYRVSGLQTNGLAGGLFSLASIGAPMIPLEFQLPVAGPVTADLDCIPQACNEDNDNIQVVVTVVDQNGDPVNLQAATTKQLRFLKPDGTTFVKDAAFTTSGVDGKLEYSTLAADLPETGTYQVQAAYVMDGKTQTTRRAKFRVGPNIEE